MKSYWAQRHASVQGLRAVGRIDRSEAANEREYETSRALLRSLLCSDFESFADLRALDIGFGHGHDAHLLAQLGVRDYVGLDFAAPPPTGLPQSYQFVQADVCDTSLDLGNQFAIILAMDVAFHIVHDDRFHDFLEFLQKHSSHLIYVTGLFRDETIAPHVRHRRLEFFTRVGEPLSIHPWRDTLLARIRRRVLSS